MANRQIVLDQHPQGPLSPEHFRLTEVERPCPGDGEVLLKARYFSVDAGMRARMQGGTYLAPLTPGQVIPGVGLAEVVESRAAVLRPGDLVIAPMGWQEYAALPAEGVSRPPSLTPETHLLSVFGVPGLTAYFGMLECGQPNPGETVVVSAAAGAVGSIVS